MSASKNKFNTKRMVEMAILLALVVILQSLGSFGYLPLCLCLVPITLGALIFGPKHGAVLGLLFGLVAWFWGLMGKDAFTYALISFHPYLTALTCLIKGTLAGLVPGLLFKLLKGKNKLVAVMVSAISAPIMNTGVFILGCLTMKETLTTIASGSGQDFVYFVFITCAGVNFLLELAINIVFAPSLHKLEKYLGEKNKK